MNKFNGKSEDLKWVEPLKEEKEPKIKLTQLRTKKES